jgi:membrane protein DedA with SNARE-associated domain
MEHEPIFIWMSQFAYEPTMVYLACFGMMLLSAVGFPLPEEVTLLSVGLLAFMGMHPQRFPPPYPDAAVVNVHIAASVAFFSVLFSDTLIFLIGRKYGRRLLEKPSIQKFVPPAALEKVEIWISKYGAYAAFAFRFTPGLRFPGHLACGFLKFPMWKFISVDAFAAAISVPTQIYLLAIYGDPILEKLREFKLIFFSLLGLVLIYFILKKVHASFFKAAA